MGRHRTNPHYDHMANGNSLHQPQFDGGNKPFIKPNQVRRRAPSSSLLSQWKLVACPYNCVNISLQGQNSPVFSHKQNLMVQMQSKDMAPRFGKKGKVNADEVRMVESRRRKWIYFVPSRLFAV